MEEQLITFKTAKLAREKGFSSPCTNAYRIWRGGIRKSQTEEQALQTTEVEYEPDYYGGSYGLIKQFHQDKEYTLAPTQALLQRWLREVHKLIVNVGYIYEYDSTPYTFFIYKENYSSPTNSWIYDYKTYEEALEIGLQEALKLIKL